MFKSDLLSGRVSIQPRRTTEKLSATVIENIGEASPEKNGLMSKEDKNKLENFNKEITKKLNLDGGEAKDTVVSFTEETDRVNIGSGLKMGILFGRIRKWFSDLKALAFKDKVTKSDLDDQLTADFNNKVDKDGNKVLSSNDFTDELRNKLNGVAEGANKYIHPSSTGKIGVPAVDQTPAFGETFSITQPVSNALGHIQAMNTRNVKIPDSPATISAAGLMTAEDKIHLNSLPQVLLYGQVNQSTNEIFAGSGGVLYNEDEKYYTITYNKLTIEGKNVLIVTPQEFGKLRVMIKRTFAVMPTKLQFDVQFIDESEAPVKALFSFMLLG